MRLIDADKLIQELEKNKTLYIDEYEEGRNTGISWCIEDVVSASTVEAIPIEWLEQLLDDAELAGQPYTINILKRILSRWEKENANTD